MTEHQAFPFLKETILYLSLAGVLIPLLQKLRINPVLGFLTVGVVIGPFGLGRFTADLPWLGYLTLSSEEDVKAPAELGVVFLMFMIGLDMSVDRLWSMRHWVFGAGGLQVLLCAAAVFGLALQFGNPPETAAILGLVLSFSSTAVVMQLLSQQRELGSPLGQASFAILLFQDLAVVPLLVLISILGSRGDGGFFGQLGLAALKGGLAVVVIYLAGRRLVRPLFHQTAENRQADSFMALTLLVTLGVSVLTWMAGLSTAMGALLAGLIIAETEFRHEVEVIIEPFKGLLMGVFFLTVGMGIDLGALTDRPLLLPLSVAGLMAIKALVTIPLLRFFKLTWGRALEGGMLLSEGGEFAFIVIGMALAMHLLPSDTGQFMLLVVGLSMLATPLVARFGRRLGDRVDNRLGGRQAPEEARLQTVTGHVIVGGFGRVGQLVAQILGAQGVPFVASETDPKRVARERSLGQPVFYGDASRPELLHRLHLERAIAVVLTMDHSSSALHAVRGIRRDHPKVRIIARARDEKHADALLRAGADTVISETLESGLQMAGSVLQALGVPDEAAARLLEEERQRRIHRCRES